MDYPGKNCYSCGMRKEKKRAEEYIPAYNNKRWAICLAVALLLPLVTVLFAVANVNSRELVARGGVADASAILYNPGLYILAGDLYSWEGMRVPAELAGNEPSLTKDIRYKEPMVGKTYRFTIVGGKQLWFLLPRPHQSRLWVNGEEVIAPAGAITAADLFELDQYGNPPHEIVLQVAGSSPYYGYQGLLFGMYEQLAALQAMWMVLDVFAVGVTLMLVVFCLVLYVNKKSETYLLTLALCAIISTLHFLLIPRHPMFSGFRLGTVTLYRQFVVLFYFACKQFLRGLVPKPVDGLIYSVVVCTFFALTIFPQFTAVILRVITIFYLCVELVFLGRGVLHGIPEASVLLGGCSLMLGNELFYVLLEAQAVPQGVVDIAVMPAQYMMALYVLAFAIATCIKFSRKFRIADTLSEELETRVQEQTKELREKNEYILAMQAQKRRFVTGIVHNLRNPLFALGGYLDLMREEPETAEKEHYIRLMDEKLIYLSKLTKDLLLLARLEDGQVEFRFSAFEVRPLLKSAADDACARHSSKQVQIDILCDDTLSIVADQYAIRQVFDNIIDNAVLHSHPNGKIEITAGRREGQTMVSVRDYGTGIEEGILQTLFRMGRQEVASKKGIGLSIVWMFLQAHNGEIEAKNEEGGGARFTMYIPDEIK